MVSFSCDNCGDTLRKQQVANHIRRCGAYSVSCLDCSTSFLQYEYGSHTSCISEAEKYQGKLFKGKKKAKAQSQPNNKRKRVDAAIPAVSESATTASADKKPKKESDKEAKKTKKGSKKEKKAKREKVGKSGGAEGTDASPIAADGNGSVDTEKTKIELLRIWELSIRDVFAEAKSSKIKGKNLKEKALQNMLLRLGESFGVLMESQVVDAGKKKVQLRNK